MHGPLKRPRHMRHVRRNRCYRVANESSACSHAVRGHACGGARRAVIVPPSLGRNSVTSSGQMGAVFFFETEGRGPNTPQMLFNLLDIIFIFLPMTLAKLRNQTGHHEWPQPMKATHSLEF
jgi:hypothetical protein